MSIVQVGNGLILKDMPNWCANTITINGDGDGFKPLKEKIQEIVDNDSKYIMFDLVGGGKNNNADNVEYFGTKWDFGVEDSSISISDDIKEITISCMTAWSPPVKFLVHLCQTYKVTAKIFYMEPGMDFCGTSTVNINGEVDDDCKTYLEGMYTYAKNEFFENELNWQVETAKENKDTWDDFKKQFDYVTEDELVIIKNAFDTVVPKLDLTPDP